MIITIGGTVRTNDVEFKSLRIRNIITRKRDLCFFNVIAHSGNEYKPLLGQEVVITDSGTKIFGGIITEIESKPSAYKLIRHSIRCQDYTRLLDRKLVPDTYENTTINDILADFKSKYMPSDFTINNVDASITVDYISFNYRPLAKCLDDLADMTNYDWYVDYNKDVHFFAKNTQIAPFNLADDDGSYDYNSLIIRNDNTQVRNTVIVRGGEYLAAQTTFELVADGTENTFHTRYKFSDFEASLTGQALNVGIYALHSPDDYDALHDFSQKLLVFKDDDKPSVDNHLKMSGKPHLPVIVKVRNTEHIASMISVEGGSGVYEYLIEDKTIKTKEGARQLGKAEIEAYGRTLSEGEFVTETSGLYAGQKITIVSASRGINQDFIINRVTITQRDKDNLRYDVSLITKRTADLLDVLHRLLLDGTKKIEINVDETIDIVLDFSDTMNLEDIMGTISSFSTGYEWEANPAVPHPKLTKWNKSTWKVL